MAPAPKGANAMRRAGGLADADVISGTDAIEAKGRARSQRVADKKARGEPVRSGESFDLADELELAYTEGHAAGRKDERDVRRRADAAKREDARKRPIPERSTPSSSTSTRRSSSSSRSRRGVLARSKPVRAASRLTVNDGAGVLLGAVAYALFLAYVRGGTSGVRQWLAAKFLNHSSNPTAQNPSGLSSNDSRGMLAWIHAHPGQLPHPGAGNGDFWNAIAQGQR